MIPAKQFTRLALASAAVLAAQGTWAAMCTLDPVPAATLLLPYFEVDLEDPEGMTTVFSLNNAAPEPTLAHAIFWTDWGLPTIDFDIFLTGYDSVTFDLREPFLGNLPVTADELRDPDDTISPHGDPSWDGSFPGCATILPFNNPVIQGPALDRLLNGHTGQPVGAAGGSCLGHDHGDSVVRGAITFDNTQECSLVLDPGDPAYFVDGGLGIANTRNVLWGDFFYVDRGREIMSAHPLVHIEADASFTGSSAPSGVTFYRTWVGESGRDHREPLGSSWAVRYSNGLGPASEVVAWRDPTHAGDPHSGEICGFGPDWLPLDERSILCFSEKEDSSELCGPGSVCLPLATQTMPMHEVPFLAGWCRFDLNHECPSCVPGPAGPSRDIGQSYVLGRHQQFNGLVGLSAVELASSCTFEAFIFADGFESGDFTAWSVS